MNKLRAIQKLISLAGPAKIMLMVLTGVLSGLTGIGLMGAAAWIISYAALQPPLYALTLGITCVRFFGISRAVMRYLMRLFSHRLAFCCYEKLQIMIYRTMCRELPLKTTLAKQGQYMEQLGDDASVLRDFYLRWLLPVFSTGLITLCFSLWLYEISPAAAGLVCFLFILHIILPVTIIMSDTANKQSSHYRDLLSDASCGRDELILSGRFSLFMTKLDEAAQNYDTAAVKQCLRQELADTILDIVRRISFVLYLLLLIQALNSGSLDPRWLAVWLLLLLGLYGELSVLSSAAVQLISSRQSAERVLKEFPKAEFTQEPVPANSSSPFLSAKNISFSYTAGLPVFAPLSFELENGGAIAVRGDSGSGKTTLAQLILKLLPLEQGELYLSGIPIGQISDDVLRSYFAASIQPCHIFSDSIRGNFTRLHPDITDEKIWQALDTACLGDTVRAMRLQLDEPMGENGSRLSGGQRNRLLTALALASEAPCLILDEPTDGLDKTTGTSLLENIISHITQKGKTLILITHDKEAASMLPKEIWLSPPQN
ncbi:thiol reductant ABC exporter subunit CydC [Schwartzia sp. (in: firmicutes)]